MPPTNYDRLIHDESPSPRDGARGKSWTIKGIRVSVMRRDDAGVDGDEPWIASCDTHGEMLGCSTKVWAMAAARNREWCSGCRG